MIINGFRDPQNQQKMAILALFTPLTKNRRNFTSAMLLNGKLVTDFKADSQYPTSRTTLFYNYDGSTWEFSLNHFVNTVSTRLFEDETNPFIWINVLSYKPSNFSREKTVNSVWKINAEAILFAYDINATTSFVFVKRGGGIMTLRTSHLVADLSRSFSRSQSLSRS